MLIGIAGRAGAGKDLLAGLLRQHFQFTRLAFADPLKRAAQEIFGLSDAQTWRTDLKEIEVPYWGMSPRRMLQLLGTEAVQPTFGREVWVKRWKLTYDLIKDSDHVVVPDVRFESEALVIREMGGYLIRIERNNKSPLAQPAQAHQSETGFETAVDLVLYNDSTPADLLAQCLQHIKIQEIVT